MLRELRHAAPSVARCTCTLPVLVAAREMAQEPQAPRTTAAQAGMCTGEDHPWSLLYVARDIVRSHNAIHVKKNELRPKKVKVTDNLGIVITGIRPYARYHAR